MPRASTSTLRMPSASMSSLSHSTMVRSPSPLCRSAPASSSGSRVMTKPPTCWDRWRGKPMSSPASSRTRVEVADRRDRGRLPGSARPARRSPQPQIESGERGDDVLGQAEHLADLAHGALGAVGDDGGGEAGAVAAVAAVDVLDHLLAPLVLEIDVDVGRLVALGGEEPLEEQVDAWSGSTSVMPRQ